jgi:hypothetical protein
MFPSIYNNRFFISAEKLDRPVFIWGAPRSGTTLLYNLIAKHPAVGYPGAEHQTPLEGTGIWWQTFGEHRGRMAANLADLDKMRKIRSAYHSLLATQKKTRLLDKIPFMILWVPLVNKVFPDARHIHIIRDGRAVVNSIVWKLRYSDREKDRLFREEKLFYGPQPPELTNPMDLPPVLRHARQWVLLVEEGKRSRALLGERYHEVRYEDLVSSPRSVMEAVLNYCMLETSEETVKQNIPDTLPNRNRVWTNEKKTSKSSGFETQRALKDDEMDTLREMDPLLKQMGYVL